MATIRRLPSGKWNVQIRRDGKQISSSTHATQEVATAWASNEERVLNQEHPMFIDAGYAYCHEVLEGKPSQGLALSRIDRICQHSAMKGTVDTITMQDINSFKKARLAKVAETTCRDELMMIRRVYRWYISEHFAETGKMLENPCEMLKLPSPSKPRDKVITRVELALLLRAMTPEMAVIVELAYETAMRRSEILKLTPDDLFLEQRFLRVVDGKEGSRDVPLTKRAVELLRGAVRSTDAPFRTYAPSGGL